MKTLDFCYQLTEEEVYESLLCLSHKREKHKMPVIWSLCLIAFVYLVLYIRSPGNLLYLVICGASVGVAFAILYGVPGSRRRRARRIAAQKGEYRVTLSSDGVIRGHGMEPSPLKEKARLYESPAIFTVQTANQHTFCLPKRAMTEEEQAAVRQILQGCPPGLTVINTPNSI